MSIGYVLLEKVIGKKIIKNLTHPAVNKVLLERDKTIKDEKIKKKF